MIRHHEDQDTDTGRHAKTVVNRFPSPEAADDPQTQKAGQQIRQQNTKSGLYHTTALTGAVSSPSHKDKQDKHPQIFQPKNPQSCQRHTP